MSEVILNSENFEQEVLKSDIPVFVDFFATWCGPCKMVAPHVAKLADTFAGQVKVCKLDVDEAPEIAGTYNVSSIPTMILFKDGQVVSTRLGAATPQVLEAFVKQAL